MAKDALTASASERARFLLRHTLKGGAYQTYWGYFTFKLGLAVVTALALAGPAGAATISSGTAFTQHNVTVRNAQSFPGVPVEGSTSGTVNFAQFDPIFGSLDRVDLVFDITSALQILVFLRNSGVVLQYNSDLSVTIGGVETTVLDYSYQTYAPGISAYVGVSGFDRELVRMSFSSPADLAHFTGSGTAGFDVSMSQSLINLSTPGSFAANLLSYNQPALEQVSAISVEYSFTPGVQTAQTQLGLLSFSSAFVPEITLERVGASVVPLPAGVWLMLGGLVGLAGIGRRRAA